MHASPARVLFRFFSCYSLCPCRILARNIQAHYHVVYGSSDPAPRGVFITSSTISYRVAWAQLPNAVACVSEFLIASQLQYDIMHLVHIGLWAGEIHVRNCAQGNWLAT